MKKKFNSYDYAVRNWVSKKDKEKLATVGRVNRLTGGSKARMIQYLGGKCACCGDSKTSHLNLHHKKEIADGGTNVKDNLMVVCANCHSDIHYC